MWENIKFHSATVIGVVLVFGFIFYVGLEVFRGEDLQSGGWRKVGFLVDVFAGVIDILGPKVVGAALMVASVVSAFFVARVLIKGG